jgi:hypothetical protein
MGVGKTLILSRLKSMGIRVETGRNRMTNPNNFRHHNPPYGYQVKDGKLVLNKSELKVCRLVVELIGRKNKSARETARELINKKLKNRNGDINWGHLVVQKIFKRWKDKI